MHVTWSRAHGWARRLGIAALAACAVFAPLTLVFAPAVYDAVPAYAYTVPQPVTPSYYVDTQNATTLEDWGESAGSIALADNPAQVMFVTLDFGSPCALSGGGYGADVWGTIGCESGTEVRDLVDDFVYGYAVTTGNSVSFQLWVAVSTNNSSGSAVGTASGTMWGNMVTNTANDNGYASQVAVFGASDMEPGTGFDSYTTTVLWLHAYDAVADAPDFVDVGATNCPTSGPYVASTDCGVAGWTAGDEYYVERGSPLSLATPQIYNESSNNAIQQALLALFGIQYKAGAIFFIASATQKEACIQRPAMCSSGVGGTENTPSMGFNQLSTQVDSGHYDTLDPPSSDTDWQWAI